MNDQPSLKGPLGDIRRPPLFPTLAWVLLGVAILWVAGMAGCPVYNVWRAKMEGEAELAQAEQNRQIAIAQSKAKAEAARYEAEAEVARANGVAAANKIIGDSLRNNEAYLRYLWINDLANVKDRTVVYVPTEANLPILEAGRTVKKSESTTGP
jgi:hypothetical protein